MSPSNTAITTTEQQQQANKAKGDGGALPSAIEFEPPLACVRRILKNSLPSSTNVGKDASAAFARASGIFIIYLTACANDFARENKRQTITANDVLAAIKELDFDEFTPEMLTFLDSYRLAEKSKKNAKAAAAAAKQSALNSTPTNKMMATEELSDDEDDDDDQHKRSRDDETDSEGDDEKEPDAKRAKTDSDDDEDEA